MQFIRMLIHLLLIGETVRLSNAFLFRKSKKKINTLIAAKDDSEMPRKVRQLLEEIGDKIVLKMQLGRTPVKAVLLAILNLLSSGKFLNKQLELGYDEIYHNYLLITVKSDQPADVLQKMLGETAVQTVGSLVYKLEKAHRVRLMKPEYPTEFIDLYNIPLTRNKNFTLNRLITTASNIDKHFYAYDAGNNNMCQTFVENIVDINGLTPNIVDHATRVALKPQDSKALIETLGSRKDIVKGITDLGGLLDKWVHDRKIVWKKPLTKEYALFGDMHVVQAESVEHHHPNALQVHSDNTVAVDGMTDVVLENTDDVFNAAVALESNDRKTEKNQTRMILIAILIGILIIGVTGVIVFKWQKKKGKPKKTASISSIVNETRSDSSFTEDVHDTQT